MGHRGESLGGLSEDLAAKEEALLPIAVVRMQQGRRWKPPEIPHFAKSLVRPEFFPGMRGRTDSVYDTALNTDERKRRPWPRLWRDAGSLAARRDLPGSHRVGSRSAS